MHKKIRFDPFGTRLCGPFGMHKKNLIWSVRNASLWSIRNAQRYPKFPQTSVPKRANRFFLCIPNGPNRIFSLCIPNGPKSRVPNGPNRIFAVHSEWTTKSRFEWTTLYKNKSCPTPNTLRYAHTLTSDVIRPIRLISSHNIKKRPIVSQYLVLGT